MGTPRTSRAVQVMIYDCGSGQFMVGIREKYWRGRDQVMVHLARVRPLKSKSLRPPGVTAEVWWAYLALEQVVQEQQRIAREGGSY